MGVDRLFSGPIGCLEQKSYSVVVPHFSIASLRILKTQSVIN
jgi:hypothetical protein